MSYTEITINNEKIKVKKTTRSKYMSGEKNIIGMKWYATSTNINPVINSTTGYWWDIFSAHRRHLPNCITYEKIGISSYHRKLRLQVIQIDRPVTIVLPVLNLKITTFKKLPIIVPNKKIKIKTSIFMYIV